MDVSHLRPLFTHIMAAKARSMDMIQPLVLEVSSGDGLNSPLKFWAEESGMEFIDVRMSMLHPSDFSPLEEGGNRGLRTGLPELAGSLPSPGDKLMLLSDPLTYSTEFCALFLSMVAQAAKTGGRILVVLPVTSDQVDEAVKAVSLGLDIRPVEVLVRTFMNKTELLAGMIAFGRSQGINADILDFLEERGEKAGATFRAWCLFADILKQDMSPTAREAMAVGILGQSPFDEFNAWFAQRAQ